MKGITIMSVDKAYLEIAERALLAADGAQSNAVHEKATFMGYHAFESIGGAFCTNRGKSYPLAHASKITMFVHEAMHESYAVHVAQLATSYRFLRNAVLYPSVLHGHVTEPKNVITNTQAIRLVGRTKSLVKKVKATI